MEDKILTAILDAYREGVFPMAESAQNDDFAFYDIENFQLSENLELITCRALRSYFSPVIAEY